MTDRDSHRAAVEAGYASLAEYIKKWGDDKMDLPKRLRKHDYEWSPQDAKALGAEAADEIERLREEVKAQKLALNHAGDAAFEMLKQDDEIERLREQERKMTNHALERMEEIERLREALKRIADYEGGPVDLIWLGMAEIARSALQQKESE